MTPRAKPKPEGFLIPWPLVGVAATLFLAGLGGLIWVNVQIATMAQRVEFLYALEMDRYPRAGPPAEEK